jgi:hypothetical protein
MSSTAFCNPISGAHSTCHSHQVKEESPLFKLSITITRVALAAISFLVDPYLFTVFATAGFLLGVYKAIRKEGQEAANGSIKGCSNDFLEKMANATFPPEFSFFVGAMMFACHIEHHPIVFVPLMAGATGYWIGKGVVDVCRSFQHKTHHTHSH